MRFVSFRGFMTGVTCTNSTRQESVVESFHGIDSEAAARRPGQSRDAAAQYGGSINGGYPKWLVSL